MVDFPFYMGFAPLLALCLDAVVPTRSAQPLIERWAQRAALRFEFVLRTAFPNEPIQAGRMLALWLGAMAWLAGTLMATGSYVMFQDFGRFVAWTTAFFFLLRVRRASGAAVDTEAALLQHQPETARAWLEHLDSEVYTDDVEELSGAAVHATGLAAIWAGLLTLVWGSLLGPGVAAAAVTLHEVGRLAETEGNGDGFWGPVETVNTWLAKPAAWAGAMVGQFLVAVAGGRGSALFAGFVSDPSLHPADRLARGVAFGLDLGPSAGGLEAGQDVVPEDIRRAVILLWTTCFAVAGLSALVGCVVYGLL